MALNRYDADKMTLPLCDDFEDTPIFVSCEKCEKPVESETVETVELLTERNPDVYEDQVWCMTCRERAEYLSDPFNEAYERARARGWED
jgi:hypothetical protein